MIVDQVFSIQNPNSEIETASPGTIVRVAGPVVVAEGLKDVQMYEVVSVGHMRLVGEVIRLSENLTTIQVYEDTGGLCVGEPVTGSNRPGPKVSTQYSAMAMRKPVTTRQRWWTISGFLSIQRHIRSTPVT